MMEIKISLSDTDLERIRDVLGIEEYEDIHKAFIDAIDQLLTKEENK